MSSKKKGKKNINKKVVAMASAGVMTLGVASPLMNPITAKAVSAPTITPNKTTPTQESVMLTLNYPSDASQKRFKIGNHVIGRQGTADGGIYVRGSAFNNSQTRILEVDGKTIYEQNGGRGVRLTVLHRTTRQVVFDQTYDTYGSATAVTDLANKMNSYGSDVVTILTSFDAMTIDTNLSNAINRVGGNIDTVSAQRLPYVLIGIPGLGRGNGLQHYTNTTDQPIAEISTKWEGDYGNPYGMWLSYAQPVVVTNDETTVYAKSIDSAGASSPTTSYTVSNIERTAPVVNSSLNTTSPTNQNVTATISATDSSGVARIMMPSTGNGLTAKYYQTKENGLTVPTDETTLLASRIDPTIDFAWGENSPATGVPTENWISEWTGMIYAPETGTYTFRTLSDDGSQLWINNDLIVDSWIPGGINVNDRTVTINLTGGKWYPIRMKHFDYHSISEAHLYWKTPSQSAMSIVPTGNLSPEGTWVSGSSASHSISQNGTYQFMVEDNAGNRTVKEVSVNNIDKNLPDATITPSTTELTNQNVVLNLVGKDSETQTFTNYNATLRDHYGEYSSADYAKEGTVWKVTGKIKGVSAVNQNVTASVGFSYGHDDGTPRWDAVKTFRIGDIMNTWTDFEGYYTVPTTANGTQLRPWLQMDIPHGTAGYQVDYTDLKFEAVGMGVDKVQLPDGTFVTGSNATYSASQNGTFTFKVYDKAGNVSTHSYTVSNIDKTPPANAVLTPSATAPTNQNVSVSISYPTDATVKQYKIGSTGTWTTYTSPIVLSANNTIYARSYDSIGNVSTETNLAVNNIDKVAPTTPSVSADVTTATNGNVVLTATFPSDASIKEYSLNGGTTWVTYTNPVTFTGNGTFQARAKDSAGNVSSVASYTVSNIDKTAPATATLNPSITSQTNQDVSVTISYPSDAVTKQYKIGSNGTWTNYTTPVVLTANNTVYARSFDAVGNISNESNLVVSNIDKVAPTTTISYDSKPTNGDVVITVNATDPSGIMSVRLPSGLFVSPANASYTATENGTYTFETKDRAGNKTVDTVTISNIDKTAPVTATLTPSTTSPTNQDVSVSIAYPSDASVKQYKIGSNGTWTAYTTPVVVSSNNTVYARSYDAVGNLSEESSLVVNNIDKVAPTTTISYDSKPTNGDVVITVNATDPSGIMSVRLPSGLFVSPANASYTATENGTYTFETKDRAGNRTVDTVTISNIDKTAPLNATLSASTTVPSNQNVTVTIGYPSDSSIKQYKIGATGTWMNYTTPVVLSSNNTVYARSYDAVGNVSAETSLVVNNIDKIAPNTPTISADVIEDTNGNVTLSATFPSDASVKEYRLNNGSWTPYTIPIVMTANGTMDVRAKDQAGNYSAIENYEVSNIDKTAPSNATLTASTTSPTNQNVSVTINYPADASVKQYKIGSGGTWTSYTTPVVLSANNTIYARSYDAVGNVSTETNLVVSNIDKVAPTTPTVTADITANTNGDVTLTATFPNDASVKEYSLNGGTTWLAYTAPVKFTANGTFHVRTKDVAGNISAIGNYTVSNIDKTAPELATLSADKTSATNTDVNVTISYPSDSSVKQFKIGSTGTWTSYTTPVVLSSNNTVYARSIDAVGNMSAESSYAVTNIDKVAPSTPTISADVTTPTNGNVILTATFPSDAVTKEYSVNNGATWTGYTGTVTMATNGTLQVRAKDSAGNVSSIGSYTVTNIDKTAPTTPTLSPSTTNPTNEDVTVMISYPSDASVKEVRVNGGSWTAYTSPIVMTTNGTIEARAKDVAGNYSSIGNLTISNIDKVAPTTPTISADVTEDTNKNVNLTATFPSDAVVKEYSTNGGSTWIAYTSPVAMTANGTLQVRAKDSAGNVSSIGSYSVTNIDKTPPAKATLSPSTTSPSNQDISVSISYPGDATVKQYKIGSTGEWTSYTNPVLVSANDTIYARSYDAVGNVSSESSLVVSNIDKIAPNAPIITANVTAPTNGNVILTGTFANDASVTEYSVDGGQTWLVASNNVYTMTTNGSIQARSKDSAGNYSAVTTYTVSNIDKTAPANATFVADKITATNTDVKVTISYPTDATVKQYKIGNTGTWVTYSNPVVVSSNNTVYARSYDAVGNVSAETSYVVNNIDKVAPTTPTISADVTEDTNGNVVVTATFPNDAVVKEYSLNGGTTWLSYTDSITMTSNGTFQTRAKDSAGNFSAIASYVVDNIDKVAPIKATFTPSTTSPTNQNVSVTISYPNDATVKQYKIGSAGVWTTYSSPVVVSSNDTIYARSYDAVGNGSEESSVVIANIDKIAPTSPSLSADKTSLTNQNVIVTATFPSDSVKNEVRVNGGSWNIYTSPITITENGKVEVRSTDNAGNISSVSSYQVNNIDKIAPELATLSANTTAPTNQDVVVTATFPSDVVKKEVRINNGSWTIYSEPIVMKDNGKIEVRGFDEAGNVSSISTYNVTNIDRVAPEKPSSTVSENTNKITLLSDANSKSFYRFNEGEWKEYTSSVEIEDGSYKLEVKSIDPAKNESEILTVNINMYRDALALSNTEVEKAEQEITQEAVNVAKEKVNALPDSAPEKQPLLKRVNDIQAIIDAKIAIEKALETRSEEDVKNAQEKVDLLDSSNPIIIDILPELEAGVNESDILTWVAKERYDILYSKYQMSKVAYNALVQTYYAIKYTGDTMYKMAEDKVALVPIDDRHYTFVQDQFIKLGVDYGKFVEERIQTDAEIKAESSLQVMERNYDPSYAVNTQNLINAVEDEMVRTSMQARLDNAKAKYESSQLDKASQDAIASVVKAETTKQTYYVTEAYKKVNSLINETLKTELTTRLQALESQMALDRKISDATRTVELAEQYKYDSYITSAQTKVSALPDGEVKTSLQTRLDSLKSGQASGEQATIIKQATNYVSLAYSIKTQYYVDKAQGYVNQILDPVKKSELQAKLDSIVIK